MRTLIVFVLAAACGNTGPAPIALEDFEQSWIAATCQELVDCGVLDDIARCPLVESPYRFQLDAARAGLYDFDAVQAGRCIDFLERRGCVEAMYPRDALLDCESNKLFAGKLPAGAACGYNVDGYCAGSCNFQPEWPPYPGCPSGPSIGTCGPADACSACTSREYCDRYTRTCAPVHLIGEQCDYAGNDCDTGLYCAEVVENDTLVARCTEKARRGESCAQALCGEIGDVCQLSTQTCEAVRFTGDACEWLDQCWAWAEPANICDSASNTCVPRPHVGEACVTTCVTASSCFQTCDGYCYQGNCVEGSRENGAVCDENGECASGHCPAGTCASGCP